MTQTFTTSRPSRAAGTCVRRAWLVAVLGSALSLAACGDDGSSTTTGPVDAGDDTGADVQVDTVTDEDIADAGVDTEADVGLVIDDVEEGTMATSSPVVSVNIGELGWVATRYELLAPDGTAVSLPPEAPGRRITTAWVEDEGQSLWIGYEYGEVYRSTDGGGSWVRAVAGLEVADLVVIDIALRRAIPQQFLRDSTGRLWLLTFGRGLVLWDEENNAWTDGTWPGTINPLGQAAVELEGAVVVGLGNPVGIVPPAALALLGSLLVAQEEPGLGPVRSYDLPEGADIRTIVDLGVRDGQLVMATLGNGVWAHDGNDWALLGPGTADRSEPIPADVHRMDVARDGRIALVTLSGAAWLYDGSRWVQVRCAGDEMDRGRDVRFRGTEQDLLMVGAGASIEIFTPDAVECPTRGGATVLLTFSQHVNLYHSYRGNTNDDDGFGKDIDIIRSTIEIFDRYPAFHNDWDIENLFSLDDWLVTYAPDILEDVARRVNAGTDGLRIMSWNNGMHAVQTEAELNASITRATASFEAYVPGNWTPGINPQENMYTPAQTRYLRDGGVEWMTLFYSATSFTGFRSEIDLSLREAHSVVTLASPVHPETLPLISVYQPGDIYEHGGLANWLRQLHQNLDGTVVLAIHMDADSDTWLGIETDLQAVEAMDADWVQPRRLQDVIAELEPVATITIERDVADGAFDGFHSWTEKDVNHEFFTRIERSRFYEERTRQLSDPLSKTQQEALDEAFEARMRGLSTTHFGLANPELHPDREADGTTATVTCQERAFDALEEALDDAGITAGSAWNWRDEAVFTLVPTDAPVEATDSSLTAVTSGDQTRSWLVGTAAPGVTVLQDATPTPTAGTVEFTGWGPALDGVSVLGPVVSFDGVPSVAEVETSEAATFAGATVTTVMGSWNVGDQPGAVRYDWIELDDDPEAIWVAVEVTWPTIDDQAVRALWDDVIPLGLNLDPGDGWSFTRRVHTGEVLSFRVDDHRDAINNAAGKGWVIVSTEGGASLGVTTQTRVRAAPAFLPTRLSLTADGRLAPTLAPFGALFGELADHKAQRLLGLGLGEYVTRLVAPQLQSTAPAWNGKTLSFLLRLQPGATPADAATLDDARDAIFIRR